MIDVRSNDYDTIKSLLAEFYNLPKENSVIRRREITKELASYSIPANEVITLMNELPDSRKERGISDLQRAIGSAINIHNNGQLHETSSPTA